MGKMLRVLTVFFFLLSAAALTLGILLFNQRELLLGRTKKLEDTMIELATYIEDQVAEPMEVDYPERDSSDCTPQVLVDPERTDFWTGYSANLEQQGLQTVDLGSRKNELMTYYKRDPITLKVIKDEYGRSVTTGKGTMQNVLDEFVTKAEEQLNRLNATRQQLADIRGEYITTIEELNERKAALRSSLAEIVRLNDTIAQLEARISQLEQQVAELEAIKRDLEDQVAQLKQQVTELQEELVERNETIERQREEIKTLRAAKPEAGGAGADSITGVTRIISQGLKGTVVSVNPKWKFVVIELNPEFMSEIKELKAHLEKKDIVGSVPAVELLIRRPGANGEFVTKARLIQLRSGQDLGVCDVLPDWQQLPVQVGDVVFF